MRDLEQAKAEVFRRGNARIKKRKAIRRSILACCVPLVLCIGIFSVTIFPAMMPASAMDSAESGQWNGTANLVPEADAFYQDGTTQDILYGFSASIESSHKKEAVICIENQEYPISDQDAEIIWNILKKLDYNPHWICRCLPKCQFEMKSKSYGLHLGEGYARCDKGQASLSQEQLLVIRDILSRNQIEIN